MNLHWSKEEHAFLSSFSMSVPFKKNVLCTPFWEWYVIIEVSPLGSAELCPLTPSSFKHSEVFKLDSWQLAR